MKDFFVPRCSQLSLHFVLARILTWINSIIGVVSTFWSWGVFDMLALSLLLEWSLSMLVAVFDSILNWQQIIPW